jgi:tRNA (adenine37-N6)-methyltransferase
VSEAVEVTASTPPRSAPGAPLELREIGVVRSAHAHLARTPRQPGASVEREARVVLHAAPGIAEALRDLAGMERVWLLTWFDRVRGWKPMVLPPRGPRVKRGVFATRSPHRPNPIGLSLVRLLSVRGRTLRVADVDLLDGTPVLDIKPYHPSVEAWPEARAGWIDDVVRAEQDGTAFPNEVAWSERAAAQREWLWVEHGVDLMPLHDVLRRDAAPHPYRRVEARPDGDLQIAWRAWRLRLRVEGSRVAVLAVESGYAPEAVAATPPGELVDDAAQRAFARAW